MEYIEGKDLRDYISDKHRFSDAEIRKILFQLFIASDYLLKKGLCHRDIKVDNIRVRPNGDIVLLDLGVLKLIDGYNITDDERSKYFVGTLRYSPPEMLHRKEADDYNGWLAITIYQIGTVLYELIQGSMLFGHISEPFADLVLAVDNYKPPVLRSDVGQDLIQLTRRLLVKDPSDRLKLVDWHDLKKVSEIVSKEALSYTHSQSRLDQYLKDAAHRYQTDIEEPSKKAKEERDRALNAFREAISIAKEELQLKHIEFPAPKIDIRETPKYVLITSQFNQSLRDRLPNTLRLVVLIPRDQEVIEHLVIHGLGLHAHYFIKDVSKTNDFIAANNLNGVFEVIWNDLFDAEEFKVEMRKWTDNMLEKYFKDTEHAFDRDLERDSKMISTRRGKLSGGVVMSEIGVATTTAFNTQIKKVIKRI